MPRVVGNPGDGYEATIISYGNIAPVPQEKEGENGCSL